MRRAQIILDDWLFSAGVFVSGIFVVSLVGADQVDIWMAEVGRAVKAVF